jgi:hypothetical protein
VLQECGWVGGLIAKKFNKMVTQVRDICSGRNVSGICYDIINKRMGVALYSTSFDVIVMVMEKIMSI